ncbi:DUF488 family protein [Enterobacter hormaechei]|uniref:DUF488 family protein n=1 Tax=Enterobacter hormaechei TaxID=158836 RepID=UPI0039059237
MVLANRCHRQNMKTSIINGSEVSRLSVAIQFADACLLCSEHKPHHCHRRLVAEYLADKWPDVTIMHL